MAGKLYIVGEVFEWAYEASLQHVRNELERMKDETEIDVYIHSPGGSYYEGVAIFNELRSSGKKINTIGQGLVGSIATVIMLAAKKENRSMMKLTEFFIHNPWNMAIGDADQFESAAKEMRQLEESMAKFYQEETGVLTIEEIKEKMSQETFLTAEQAVEFGFASKVLSTQQHISNTIMMLANKNVKFNKNSDMSKIKQWLGLEKKALTITTNEEGGVTVEGEIAVGETVTVDGEQAPNDTHTFEGVTFVTVDGVITEIVEEEEEQAQAQAQSQGLTAEQVTEAVQAALKPLVERIDAMENDTVEALKALKNTASNHKPVQKKEGNFSKGAEVNEKEVTVSKLEELRAKRNENRKK